MYLEFLILGPKKEAETIRELRKIVEKGSHENRRSSAAVRRRNARKK
jgi:hypothetical protein